MTVLFEKIDPSDEELRAETIRVLDEFRAKVAEGQVTAFSITWIGADGRETEGLCSATVDDAVKLVAQAAHNSVICNCGAPLCEYNTFRDVVVEMAQALVGGTLADPGKGMAH